MSVLAPRSDDTGPAEARRRRPELLAVGVTVLGVVYGDIGTSPLYALRECFRSDHGMPLTAANVLGVLSLTFWALVIVISIKYLTVVMRADNRGEGGILALLALVRPGRSAGEDERWGLVTLGLFGAALLYGDGAITPAISVLSAVEGLQVATVFFAPYVVAITIAILIALFVVQRRGTAGVGRMFGPITLIWFAVISALGLAEIAREPGVLRAVNPAYGIALLGNGGWQVLLVLGAVFLVVTGGEALYADMGHFGPRPIRVTWFAVVLPALLLSYFGQGALLLSEPASIAHPFFHLAPEWALYPLVVLATAATVVASQAVISGCFSLTRQAIQLGFCPRMRIQHTSPSEVGQIYVAAVNWTLMAATVGLVLGFRSASKLAAAYGLAVSTTMTITTLLLYVVMRERWRWPRPLALALIAVFLTVDLAFLSANSIKFFHGGWFPLLVAGAVFALMSTWKRGRQLLADRLALGEILVRQFLEDIEKRPPLRVPGTAIFLAGRAYGVPPALLHNLRHNRVLHERVVLMTVLTVEEPRVLRRERVEAERLEAGFWRVVLRYGFMEQPNVLAALPLAKPHGLDIDLMTVTFFLGRETVLATARPGMALWREHLFVFMARNAQRATAYFGIPSNQVIEIGTEVEL